LAKNGLIINTEGTMKGHQYTDYVGTKNASFLIYQNMKRHELASTDMPFC